MSISSTTALWRARLRYWLGARRQGVKRLLGRDSEPGDAYLRIAEALALKHETSGLSPEESAGRGLVEALEVLTDKGTPK